MKSLISSVVILALMTVGACKKSDDPQPQSKCDFKAQVDSVNYQMANDSNFTLLNVILADDCLFVEIGSSGCSANNWELSLYDSGAIAESFPPQRYIRLSLFNEEQCQAYFRKTYSFDLSPLRIDGVNEIYLNLEGNSGTLNYQYE